VRWLDGCGFRDAVETLTGKPILAAGAVKDQVPLYLGPAAPAPSVALDYRRQGFALELWREAGSTDATPVEIYLHRRQLPAPSPDVVRFHPHCPFGQDANGGTVYTPAMLALVRNIITNEPQAIHRTALDRDSNKVEFVGEDGKPRSRRALGSMHGGAVKLTDDADVTKAVGIGEGIESTLSLQQLPEWSGSPVWSLLSKNGVRDFPVLSGIETLMIAVDHDTKKRDGQKAATAVAARWRAAGREVLLAWPAVPGDDINDVVRSVS
jgi:putative DNA primase/helicase